VSFSRGNPQGGRQTGVADGTLDADGSRPGLRWIKEGGFTAFLFAARDGDLESAKMLLAAGASINDTDGVGASALMMATRHDHVDLAMYLLEKGADPNVSEAGHSALHLAVARRNLGLVKALLARGANPNVRITRGEPDPDGEVSYNQLPEYLAGATPFLLAAGLNEVEMMKLLAASGGDAKIPMLDGTTATMASMGLFPGVFQFIPFQKISETGAVRADNPAYFLRKELLDDWGVFESVKLTLELGVDVNAARGKLTTYHVGNSRTLVGRDVGDTALHMAAADKLWNVVDLLVKAGARMDVKDRRGLTPLGIATSKNRQFQTGGGGEFIGDENIAELLRSLGAKE
jgi:ankyrin repeat protein